MDMLFKHWVITPERQGQVTQFKKDFERRKHHSPSLGSRLSAFYYVTSFGAFTYIWMLLIFGLPTIFLPLAVAFAFYACSEAGIRPTYDGSWPTPFRRWIIWTKLKEFFPICGLHKTADLAPNTPYIFVHHPHGMFAFGAYLTFGTDAMGFKDMFPGIDVRILTLNINFRAPLLREYLLLLGVCSVSKDAIITLLTRNKSVCITVGGGAESMTSQPGRYDLVLRRRKGFIRCALETGASLVPCFTFGEPDTYSTLNNLPSQHPIRRLQRYLNSKLGFTLPLAYGTGIFLPFGVLPNPVSLNTVIGAPIAVERYTKERCGAEYEVVVDRLHGEYVRALTALFDANKEKFAKGASDLVLLE